MNYHTEEEATKKWCPQSRVSCTKEESEGPSFNRVSIRGQLHFGLHPSSYCLASDCAMWVWHEDAEYNYPGNKFKERGGCGLRNVR